MSVPVSRTRRESQPTPVFIVAPLDGASLADEANDSLRVTIVSGAGSGGASMVDDSPFAVTGSSVNPSGWLFDSSPPAALASGRIAAPRMSARRIPYSTLRLEDGTDVMDAPNTAVRVNVVAGAAGGTQYTEGDTDATIAGTAILWEDAADTLRAVSATKPLPVTIISGGGGGGAGTEYTVDAVAPAAPVGGTMLVVRDDALGALTPAEGDWVTLRANADGALWVKHEGTLVVDGSGVTQPVSGTVTLGAGVANVGDVDVLAVPADPFGANADAAVAAGAAGSIQAKLRRLTQGVEDLKTTIVLAPSAVNIGDVDVVSSVLPTGAATAANQTTEITSLALLDDVVSTTGAAVPTKSQQVSGTDGTNARVLKTDAAGELQIDVLTMPTVTVADGGGSITVDAPVGTPVAARLSDGAAFSDAPKTGQHPAALVGGRVDANVGAWLGSTAPTVGQKTQANSVPVAIASDQTAITANPATGEGKTLLFVAIAQGAAGTTSLVSADATKKVKLVSYTVVLDAAGTFKFTDGTVDLTGAIPTDANSGVAEQGAPSAHLLETAAVNRALSIVTTGGAAKGRIAYFLEA